MLVSSFALTRRCDWFIARLPTDIGTLSTRNLIDMGIGEASIGSSLRTFDQSAPGDAEKPRSKVFR